MDQNSIILLYRRQQLANITSGAIDTIPAITQVAFGDGGADASGNPIPPLNTAIALGNELARFPVDSVTYPVPTTARYTVTIPGDQLTGVAISEAALVDSTGALCAIKTMSPKGKDTGVTFTFTFDDEF